MVDVLARVANLEVNEVPDGYIVYQTELDRVHYLNRTAAIVFEFCEGQLDANDIVSRVMQAFELEGDSDHEIRDCFDSLLKEGLIQSHSRCGAGSCGMISRGN
jgi:hypothetical protein